MVEFTTQGTIKIAINICFILSLGLSMFVWFKNSRLAFLVGFIIGIIIITFYMFLYQTEIEFYADFIEEGMKNGWKK